MRKLLPCLVSLMSGLLMLTPVAGASPTALVRPIGGEICLPFNDAYTCGDETRYHSGVDIAGSEGEAVKAAAAGTVVFRGYVPRPAGEGPAVLAVTVRHEDGTLASYLPLSETAITKGAVLAQGDPISALAGEGDGSSETVHLHFGLRENGRYVDPSPLPLPPPPPASTPRPRRAPAPLGRKAALPLLPRAVSVAQVQEVPVVPREIPKEIPSELPLARAAAQPKPLARVAPSPEQLWVHRRLLSSNEPRPWIDPRLLVETHALHPQRPRRAAPLPSEPPLHPTILLSISGTLLCGAFGLGKIRTFRIRVVQTPVPRPARACHAFARAIHG